MSEDLEQEPATPATADDGNTPSEATTNETNDSSSGDNAGSTENSSENAAGEAPNPDAEPPKSDDDDEKTGAATADPAAPDAPDEAPTAVSNPDLVEALLHERSGYLTRHLPDRVAQVDEQLRLNGYRFDPPRPVPSAASSAPKRTTSDNKPRSRRGKGKK